MCVCDYTAMFTAVITVTEVIIFSSSKISFNEYSEFRKRKKEDVCVCEREREREREKACV